MDLAVGLNVRAHCDGESKSGCGTAGDLSHASCLETLDRNRLAQLLSSEGDLAVLLVHLVGVVADSDADFLRSTGSHHDLLLGLVNDNCTILLGVFVSSALLTSHPRLIFLCRALITASLFLLAALSELSAEIADFLTKNSCIELTIFVGAVLLNDLFHCFAAKGSHARTTLLLDTLVLNCLNHFKCCVFDLKVEFFVIRESCKISPYKANL